MSKSRSERIFVLLGLLLALEARVVATAAPPRGNSAIRIRVPDTAGMAVKRALLAARVRLSASGCRQLLDEFRLAGPNRSLAEVLEAEGRSPEQHLDTLRFEDGSRHPRCGSPAILAFTHPGSEVVYICASQFKSAVTNDPAYAEMILIHEWLHTLGLGENPPTSLEITARVSERCGEGSRRLARDSR